jgi:4-amino-4-deoxy-L-arabinose transferase-like glycosyltransferase
MIRVVSMIVGLVIARPALGSELSRLLTGEGSRSLRQMALEAVIAIGDPPMLYWMIGIGLLSILIVASVLPLLLPVESGRSGRNAILRVLLDRRFYGLIVGFTVTGLRWPLLARGLLNTDESHAIACAMKLGVDPVFWRGIDGTTGGPLLYYPLLLPGVIGLPIGYGSARAMGLLALIGSVLLLYGIIRRLFDEGVARFAVLPLITCWGLTTSSHFAHYSSEQIPVFLITLALYFLVRWWKEDRDGVWTLVCSGLALGAIPFAKLQAVPVGLFIAACGVMVITTRYRSSTAELWKRMLLFGASGLAVPAFFVVTVVSSGVWQDFWQSYVLNNLGYRGRYLQLGDVGMSLAQRVWVVVDRSFWTYDLAELVGAVFLIGLLVLLGALAMARRSLIERGGLLMMALGLVLVSAVAVAFPKTLFSHYFLFLPVPVTLFGAVWLGIAVEMGRQRFSGRQQTIVLALLVSTVLALTVARPLERRLRRQHPVFSEAASIPEIVSSPVAEVALGFGRVGESMAVWGWQPWRFVEAGLYPATRDTQTQWQILDTPQRPYYLDRYRTDLTESLPPVFIDTVGLVEDARSPWRPVFWNRETQAHDAFPEIAEVTDEHYRQVGEIGASRLYVSNARLAELERLTGRELSNLESQELLALVPRLSRRDLGETSSPAAPILLD